MAANLGGPRLDGALLIDKEAGPSSFGVIEALQRAWCERFGVKRRDVPKMGHGGTLDPFATGLLVIGVGRGVKLARYLLGSDKTYEATIAFGRTSVAGDPTDTVSERSQVIPTSREAILEAALPFTSGPYAQTPPMHSAVKKDGKRLYELARQGVSVEREARTCFLRAFEMLSYDATAGMGEFRLTCSSGTYVRQFAQDLGRALGSVAMLDRLRRTASGTLRIERALSVAQATERLAGFGAAGVSARDVFGDAWIDFDAMLAHLPQVEATAEERQALIFGQQAVLGPLTHRAPAGAELLAITYARKLVAVARHEGEWGIERVFVE